MNASYDWNVADCGVENEATSLLNKQKPQKDSSWKQQLQHTQPCMQQLGINSPISEQSLAKDSGTSDVQVQPNRNIIGLSSHLKFLFINMGLYGTFGYS